MPLHFERHDSYGKERYYPKCDPAKSIVSITGRKCLKPTELEVLKNLGGFVIVLTVFGK